MHNYTAHTTRGLMPAGPKYDVCVLAFTLEISVEVVVAFVAPARAALLHVLFSRTCITISASIRDKY